MSDKTSVVTEPLQQALATILTKATQGIDAGVQFLGEQLPDVAQQLLMWRMVANLFWVVVAMVVLAGLVSTWIVLHKRKMLTDQWGDLSDTGILMLFVSFFIGVPSVIVFFAASLEAIQIYFAPKIYLIEYAAKLLK